MTAFSEEGGMERFAAAHDAIMREAKADALRAEERRVLPLSDAEDRLIARTGDPAAGEELRKRVAAGREGRTSHVSFERVEEIRALAAEHEQSRALAGFYEGGDEAAEEAADFARRTLADALRRGDHAGVAAMRAAQRNLADAGTWHPAIGAVPEPVIESQFSADTRRVLDRLHAMLVAKNEAYGNSALDPVRIFSGASTVEGLMTRIDDKLSRIKQGRDRADDEDVILDLTGYLVMLMVAKGGSA